MIKEQIGNCTLYCGDCMEVMDDIEKSDVLLTDPPYKMEIHGRGFADKRSYYKQLGYGTSTDFILSDEFYNKVLRNLNSKSMVLFCNKMMKLDIENWAVGHGLTFDELVLCKSAPAPLTNNQWVPDKEFAVHLFKSIKVKGNYDTKRTWFVDSNYKDSDIDHPSPKPLYIVNHIMMNITNPGETVLDTFMGSGTTGVSAQMLGRKFIGIEINPTFFDVACKRIEESMRQGDLFGF